MSNETNARFAVNTYAYILDTGMEDCIARLAEHGFRELELMMYPDHLWPPAMDAGALARLGPLITSLGLTVRTVNQPNVDINIAGASEEMRSYSRAMVRAQVTLAGELGAEGVVMGPGKPNPLFPAPNERMLGWYFAALDELVPHANACGTRLLLENMPFSFLPDADGLMESLDRYGAAEIGVV